MARIFYNKQEFTLKRAVLFKYLFVIYRNTLTKF